METWMRSSGMFGQHNLPVTRRKRNLALFWHQQQMPSVMQMGNIFSTLQNSFIFLPTKATFTYTSSVCITPRGWKQPSCHASKPPDPPNEAVLWNSSLMWKSRGLLSMDYSVRSRTCTDGEGSGWASGRMLRFTKRAMHANDSLSSFCSPLFKQPCRSAGFSIRRIGKRKFMKCVKVHFAGSL